MKILVMGLPNSGKTTLATALAERLRCPHFNADDIRKHINKDLGFSVLDRIEQARRMGHLCDIAGKYGHVIADFVCPTEITRKTFNADFVVWVDRIKAGRFEDTNWLFVPPEQYDVRVTQECDYPTYYVDLITKLVEENPMSWNVDLKITNNTKYNIDVVNNDSGQTGEIAPHGGTFDWGTGDPNNTNSLRFWDATVTPKTYYMQGGISFGPEAGVYVDRGWMAAGDQSISATFCANGNCWTQTQNGGETLLAWNQFEGGGQITAVFN